MKLSLNHYRLLGSSGLRVSPMCLGTMTFGTQWGWGASYDDCQAMVATYLERGGNFIDTANIIAQTALLAAFVWAGWRAVKGFHPPALAVPA